MRLIYFLICAFLFAPLYATEDEDYILSNISNILTSFKNFDFTTASEVSPNQAQYQLAIQMNEFNKNQAAELENHFESFKRVEISVDRFLRKLLDIRLHNINFFERHQGFHIIRKGNELPAMNLHGEYIKSLKFSDSQSTLHLISREEQRIDEMFKDLDIRYKSSKDQDVRDAFSSLINDNYLVLTKLILGVFCLRDPYYFSSDTYDYIRASRSLWPLFEQVAQGTDPFLVEDNASLFNNSVLLDDYERYVMCILPITYYTIELKSLGIKSSKTQILGPLNKADFIQTRYRSLPELPSLLRDLSEKPRTKEIPIADVASEQSILPLSHPSTPSVVSASASSSTHTAAPMILDSAVTASSSAPLSAALMPHQLASVTEKMGALKESSAAPSIARATEKQAPLKLERKEQDDRSPFHEPEEPHVFARWNRQLHRFRMGVPLPIGQRKLADPDSALIQRIFDGLKTTYTQFERLWIRINGENSIKYSKSSHVALLNETGQVVGGTFVLNGRKRQYSDTNIKELRDALTLVGYGRNYLTQALNHPTSRSENKQVQTVQRKYSEE